MVFTIGIDPHKATHTAAVVDSSEAVVAELRFAADRDQRDRLLLFATRFAPRTWAIEQATGLSALLAQQLVAVGKTVFNVPPTLSARVRLLDSTRTRQNRCSRRAGSGDRGVTPSAAAASRTH